MNESKRVRPARYATGASTAPVKMKPVKRIGRCKTHLYCPRCGSKRTACNCPEGNDA